MGRVTDLEPLEVAAEAPEPVSSNASCAPQKIGLPLSCLLSPAIFVVQPTENWRRLNAVTGGKHMPMGGRERLPPAGRVPAERRNFRESHVKHPSGKGSCRRPRRPKTGSAF